MPIRGHLLAARMPRRVVTGTVLALALALSASAAEAVPAQPKAAGLPGLPDNPDPITGKNAPKAKLQVKDDARKSAVKTLTPAAWPAPGSAELTLPSATPRSPRAAAPSPAAKADIGGLPITVAPATSRKTAKTAPPGKVKVTSLGSAKATRWGSAAVLTVQRQDAASAPAPVRLSLDYSKFTDGAGGAYGSRLRLIELPACAVTKAPDSKGCTAAPKTVESVNNPATHTVTADVSAAPSTSGATVYALTAGASSSKGDYKATSLAPSASWSVANSSGAFSWDYPLRTVPTPGGLVPTIGLGYSAQSADGRTSATNNQGSWIGEGFSYEPGYIERTYKPCSDDGHASSGEQCWAFDNATVMLNGSATSLVKDDKTGKWHFASENGAKIEQLTNATYVTGNGDNDGEHWKITTTDGTEYYFGLNRLPGWTTGKEETASTWTAPVFGDDSGEPCYNATFTSAYCKQAWRWNLDYVKDLHGNVMSYFYAAETNYYALNGKTDVNGTAYHRGGYLKRIDYGQRDKAVYTTKAPARVVFTTTERCLPDTATDDTPDVTFDCAPSKMTTANAKYWPDTPVDRACAANTKCTASQSTQTFWTTKRLVGITTQMSKSSVAGEYSDVDAWTLTHIFTDNGDDTKTLWLSKIDHEGKAGGSLKMPSVELNGTHLMNRVDSDTDNTDPFRRLRLATIVSETGAQLDITYAPRECTPTSLPKPGESTKRCYPVIWSPPGSIEPKTDWFHKYVVQDIVQTDRTGGGDDLATHYAYQGAAGWRHAEPDGITDPKYLTWSEWQGYGKVTVTSGNGQTNATRIDYTYLQGLNGDKLPDGTTRTETVTDSTGKTYTGHKEFTGFQIEAQTYASATGGKVVAKTITEPWKNDTATQTRTWVDPATQRNVSATTHATLVAPAASRGYTIKPDNTWIATKSTSTYDTAAPNGRLKKTEDLGDISTPSDDTCTELWYADDPDHNLYDLPARSEALTVDCSTTPDRTTQVMADERTTYDVYGNAIKTERLTSHDGTTGHYEVTGTTDYDLYGRPTLQKDAELNPTSIEYTDVNGLLSKTKSTNALTHVTTTDYAPAWGVSTGQTDPNGKRTDLAYDALGRLTSVWLADRSKSSSPSTPSIKYSYNVRRDKTTVVKTEKLQNDGTYGAEYQHYDSLLRARQLQTEGPNGTRMVADVFYDGTGKPKKTNDTYNAAYAPSDELLTVTDGQVGAQTAFTYDGLGRTTAEISLIGGDEQWRTTTIYDGNQTHVDPPAGGVPTTTITDAHGRVSEIRHYRSDAPQPTGPALYDTTKYTYTRRGELETVTDAKGNIWRNEYDLLGRKTKTIDPDAGTSQTEYDALDRPKWTINGNGKKISYQYDKLGRPTFTWDGEAGTGTKLTETRYDRPGYLGEAYAELRYTSPTEYFASVVQARDSMYRPQRVDYLVPASEGALKGTYSFTTTYQMDGTVATTGMPAAGGLPVETIDYDYDALQRPVSMTSTVSDYVTNTLYTEKSQLKSLMLSTGSGKKVQQSFLYEKGTERLTTSTIDIEGVTAPAKKSQYSYDQAGNILSISDLGGTTPDVQCFAYDTGQRLSEAWTPAATQPEGTGSGTVGSTMNGKVPGACTGGPGAMPLGGPAPYWKSYTTDAIGNRTQEVIHDIGLDASKNITRTYSYGDNAGPHAVTKVVENTPTGDRQSLYTYDKAGNTDSRTIGGDTQKLEWNGEDQLTKTTEADGKETTYLYDASGERVIRRDATATTVYLPGMELKLPTGGTEVQATRYYTFAGQTIAVRETNGTLSWLGSDHQGTSSIAINSATGAVSQRRFDPYGAERGKFTGNFPSEKSFVGGTLDAQTGLTHVGAREYDPQLGKFISVDPLIDYTQPQQINAYAYAGNSPVTFSDPSGLMMDECREPHATCKGGFPVSTTPVDDAQNDANKAAQDVEAAQQNLNHTKQRIKKAVKALIKIAMEELGIDAALDCFSSGDLGACGETALNIAGSFAGGLAGKLLGKLGDVWHWKKNWNLLKRVKNLATHLFKGIEEYRENSKALTKAKDALAAAQAKVKALASKGSCIKPHSFLPGTKVLLVDGSTKNIEDVTLGDKVVVTDPDTGTTTVREVAGTIVTEDDKHFVDLTITTKNGQSAVIISTTTHPFWVASEHQWVEAGNLKPGTTLRTPSGDTVALTAIHHFAKRHRTHDLTITGIHTYYVLAGKTPVLVHNSNGCRTFGSQSPTGRLDVPDTQGVYIIKMNDGKVYVGSATKTNTIHRRVHRAFSDDKHAVKSSGYKSSDVRELDWIEIPGGSEKSIYQHEQSLIDYYGGIGGGTLLNRINAPAP